MFNKRTDELIDALKGKNIHQVDEYLEENSDEMLDRDNPFASYMREMFREHKIMQQDVFLKADFSQRYGYRLISGERRTRQRDYILRLCLAADFTLEETQRALQIYGMSRLYARIPRDAVLIKMLESGVREMSEINAILESKNMASLKASPIEV